jgi:hypothetical protein
MDSWDKAQFQQNVQSQIVGAHVHNLQSLWLWSGQPVLEKSLDIDNELGQEVSDSFINAVIGTGFNHGNKNQFKGALLAYEFEMQDEALLTRRRYSEKRSLDRTRSHLVNKQIELADKVGRIE